MRDITNAPMPTRATSVKQKAAQARERRLAEQLRHNLRRRKSQARERDLTQNEKD